MTSLTQNAVNQIWQGDVTIQPVLQVIDIKKLGSGNNASQARYRLVLSDGSHFQQGMLATQQNHIMDQGLKVNSLIKLSQFTVNTVQNRRVVIVLNLELVQTEHAKVGSPVSIDAPAKAPAPGGAAANQTAGSAPKVKPEPQSPAGRNPAGRGPYGGSGPYGGGGRGGAPVSRSGDMNVFPIKSLNPYQNKWTIVGRVTAKKPIRTYHNAKGEGKLASFELLDKDGGEIKITMFNQQVDQHYPGITEGEVFKVARGAIKPANKKYNNTNSQYEITLDQSSLVEKVDAPSDIPKEVYAFRALDKLEEINPDAFVDLLGVVHETEELTNIVTKRDGSDLAKRELKIVDQTQQMVSCTLWGEDAQKWNPSTPNPIIAVKAAKVSDYGGRTVSVGFNSRMQIDPDIPEAQTLYAWYTSQNAGSLQLKRYMSDGGGGNRDERKTLGAIVSENMGRGEKPDWMNSRVTVSFINHKNNISYPACKNCKKKLVEEMGDWKCERCNESFNEANYRYLLSCVVKDHTTSQFVTLFDEMGLQLLGKTATEMKQLEEQAPDEYEAVFQEKCFQSCVMTLKVKEETYMDEARLKATCNRFGPIDFKAETRKMLNEIASA